MGQSNRYIDHVEIPPALLLLLLPLPATAGWEPSPHQPGITGIVYEIVPHGDMIAVAGDFGYVGDQFVGNIALTDGTNWYPVGEGTGPDYIYDLDVHDVAGRRVARP